jgi:hypothetical protein
MRKLHLDALVSRRMVLLKKIRMQKAELATEALCLRKPLALADTGLKAIHFFRRHPLVMSSGAILFMVLRRRSLATLVEQGWRMAWIHLFPVNSR